MWRVHRLWPPRVAVRDSTGLQYRRRSMPPLPQARLQVGQRGQRRQAFLVARNRIKVVVAQVLFWRTAKRVLRDQLGCIVAHLHSIGAWSCPPPSTPRLPLPPPTHQAGQAGHVRELRRQLHCLQVPAGHAKCAGMRAAMKRLQLRQHSRRDWQLPPRSLNGQAAPMPAVQMVPD